MQATQQFIKSDKIAALEAEKKEDDDIKQIIKKRAASIKATSFEELEQHEKKWTKDETYDVDFEMSDLESRFVSLAMTGSELDLTPALPAQIRSLVDKAKAHDAQKQRAAAERHAKEVAMRQQAEQEKADAARAADRADKKAVAVKKATKFLKNMRK